MAFPGHVLDPSFGFVSAHYEVHPWRHAGAILRHDFPTEWNDIMEVLASFRLLKTELLRPGGGRSTISKELDDAFEARGWNKRRWETQFTVRTSERQRQGKRKRMTLIHEDVLQTRTHEVDAFKNRVAIEVEWHNKDTFFDRDLYNFRSLFDIQVLSVGVIITRSSGLRGLWDEVRDKDWVTSTTHTAALIPRVNRGGAGGCPVLVFGIKPDLYVDDTLEA